MFVVDHDVQEVQPLRLVLGWAVTFVSFEHRLFFSFFFFFLSPQASGRVALTLSSGKAQAGPADE